MVRLRGGGEREGGSECSGGGVEVVVLDMIAEGRYGDLFFVRDLIVRIVLVLLSQEIFSPSVVRLRGGGGRDGGGGSVFVEEMVMRRYFFCCCWRKYFFC